MKIERWYHRLYGKAKRWFHSLIFRYRVGSRPLDCKEYDQLKEWCKNNASIWYDSWCNHPNCDQIWGPNRERYVEFFFKKDADAFEHKWGILELYSDRWLSETVCGRKYKSFQEDGLVAEYFEGCSFDKEKIIKEMGITIWNQDYTWRYVLGFKDKNEAMLFKLRAPNL